MKKSLLCSLCLVVAIVSSSLASVTIVNSAATNIQPTSAFFCGNLTATNGTTNAIAVRLCYGSSDGSTNFAWWGSTNRVVTRSSTGAFSTNVTGLAPTTHYYYRWYASQGTNSGWSTPSTSFWTTAGSPTGTPPVVAAYPVMADANGNVVTPTSNITFGAVGAEMVTNGTCASTNGWHTSTGAGAPWTLNTSSTNYYLYTSVGGQNILTQTVPLPVLSNHLYRLSLRYTGGPIRTRLGGQTTDWPGVGDWTNVTATYLASSTNSLEVCDNTSFLEGSSSVDDVSVKELRGDLTIVRDITFGGTATGNGSGLYNLVNAATLAQGAKADSSLQVESDTLATVCNRGNRITNSVVLAVYGTELTTNGTFTGNTSGWNIETFILGSEEMGYFLIAYSSDPAATASPSNALPIVVGRVYRISFSAWGATPGGSIDMIATVGGFSNVWHQAYGGPSECTAIFQASDTNNLVITSPYTGTYPRYLDNVSAVEISTGVDAMCLTGSLIFGTNAQFFGLATNAWSTNSTFLRSADGLHLYWGGSP